MHSSPRRNRKTTVAHLRQHIHQLQEETEWHRAAAASTVDAARRLQQNLAAQVRNPSSGHSTPKTAPCLPLGRHITSSA